MSDAGGADRGPIVTTGGDSLGDRFGRVDRWTQAGVLLAGFLLLFFLVLVVLSYV